MLAGDLLVPGQEGVALYVRTDLVPTPPRTTDELIAMAPAMALEEIGDAITENFPQMGIERWYVMFYSDVSSPGSISSQARIR